MSDPTHDYTPFLNSTVDDLKSTLGCRLANLTSAALAAEEERFAEGLLAACPESKVSLRRLINTHLNKVSKIAFEGGAADANAFFEDTADQPEILQTPEAKPGTRVLTLEALDVLPPVPSKETDPLSTQFFQAKTYLNGLKAMGQGAAVLAVLLGTELARLHKLYGVKAGRPKNNSHNVVGIKWEQLVKQELGISDESARRYMDLAEGAKKRLPEFAPIAEELLTTPLASLPETRRAELAEKTRNILPSESAQELAIEWGLSRRAKPRGGDTTDAQEEDKRTEEEKEAERIAALKEDATRPFELLSTLNDEWKVLTDSEIERAKDIASKWIERAEAWLQTPKKKRPVIATIKAIVGEAAHD